MGAAQGGRGCKAKGARRGGAQGGTARRVHTQAPAPQKAQRGRTATRQDGAQPPERTAVTRAQAPDYPRARKAERRAVGRAAASLCGDGTRVPSSQLVNLLCRK